MIGDICVYCHLMHRQSKMKGKPSLLSTVAVSHWHVQRLMCAWVAAGCRLWVANIKPLLQVACIHPIRNQIGAAWQHIYQNGEVCPIIKLSWICRQMGKWKIMCGSKWGILKSITKDKLYIWVQQIPSIQQHFQQMHHSYSPHIVEIYCTRNFEINIFFWISNLEYVCVSICRESLLPQLSRRTCVLSL